MASLRSMIRDGRVGILAEVEQEAAQKYYSQRVHQTLDALASRDTVLVNATSVANDLGERPTIQLRPEQVPCPKPPFPWMWLESNYLGRRGGALVRRIDIIDQAHLEITIAQILEQAPAEKADAIRNSKIATLVEALIWCETHGQAAYLGMMVYWLNREGEYLEAIFSAFPRFDDEIETSLYLVASWVLHTFARLNCDNVKLVPATAGAPKTKKDAKHPPFSVWHEIVVGEPPIRAQGDTTPDGEKRELRFHKVRGHFADYTKGKGLFGRLKIRLWIPEHAAGNPDLGTVVGSYRVK